MFADKKSIAKCTPVNSLPSIGRSLGTVAPVVNNTASLDDFSAAMSIEPSFPSPTLVLVINCTPPSRSNCTLRSTTSSLASFMLGIPYISRPPILSARS